MCEFAAARPGMLGLQTALSVVVETMVRPGLLTWRDVARVMSEAPARIVGLPDQGRPLEVGEPANLTVVDPDATWTVAGAELASRSDNTPYESMTLPAVVTLTLLRGKVTARDGKSPAAPAMNTADAGRLAGHGGAAGAADRVADPAMMRGWRHRAAAAGRADRHAAAAAGHRRARDHPGHQGPLRRQHARAELERPGRRRRPRLPRQGRAHPLSRRESCCSAPAPARSGSPTSRSPRSAPNAGIAGKALTHDGHSGHPVAAAVGHRDRHRVPRRRPPRILAQWLEEDAA